MGLSATDISWLVLLPTACVSLLVALLSVLRYQRQLRSLDVFVMSFLAALMLNLCCPVLIQLLLSIRSNPWTPQLCVFYVWAWDALRFVQILTLFVLSLDRIFIFRNAASYKFYGSKDKFYLTLVLWVFSGFLAVIPVAGWTTLTITTASECGFVAPSVSMYYGLSIAIVITWFMLMTLGCGVDALYNMRTFRVDALESLDQVVAEPSTLTRSTLQRRANSANSMHRISTLQRIYRVSHPGLDDQKSVLSDATSLPPELLIPTPSSIETAFDNCRFALIAILVSYGINHLPYVLMCLCGSLAFPVPSELPTVALWLVLLEALLWPHLLWLCNERYKKGYIFIWDVLRCKENICENDYGDGGGVRLQAYNLRPDDFCRDSRPPSFRLNTLDDVMRLSRGEPFMLGAMRRYHDNLAQRGVLDDPGASNSSTALCMSESNLNIPRQLRRNSSGGPSLQRSASDIGHGSRGSTLRKSFPAGTPRRSVHADHVRSPPLSSRLQWKQRMRKLYLPADYIEELERREASTNPLYNLHNSQNFPEELDTNHNDFGGRGSPPLASSLQTISSCGTMVIHNEAGSTMELDRIPHLERPEQDLREMFSDTAIENAMAVQEMNRAAISRESKAHCHSTPKPSSPTQDSENSDSWEEIFVDAVSDVGIFYTQGSGSSVSNANEEDEWLVVTSDTLDHSDTQNTPSLVPRTSHESATDTEEFHTIRGDEPHWPESVLFLDVFFITDTPSPVPESNTLMPDSRLPMRRNMSSSTVSQEGCIQDDENHHQSVSELSMWTTSRDTLTDSEYEHFHSAADLLQAGSSELLDGETTRCNDGVPVEQSNIPVREEGELCPVDSKREVTDGNISESDPQWVSDTDLLMVATRGEQVQTETEPTETNQLSPIRDTKDAGDNSPVCVSAAGSHEPMATAITEDRAQEQESPKLSYSKII